MNTDFDTDFENALNLISKDFTHNDLIKFLQTGSVAQKQFAALELDSVNSLDEAQALVNNLTGCDGKIREAVSLKINYLLKNNKDCIPLFNFPQTFADSSIDINPNVCRFVIESVSYLKEIKDFSKVYIEKILEFTKEAFNALDNFIFRDKKYVINKQLFKLYWCLESLKLFVNNIDEETLYEILEKASCEKEYTIREKAAQILILLKSEKFNALKEILKNDENYYVRVVFN